MKISFFKYQGAGNDFVVIDNRDGIVALTTPQIEKLCDRKFGVGADGIMVLETTTGANFRARYYNPDGSESFCGNGSRAITAFAHKLGLIKEHGTFLAIDGVHEATVLKPDLIKIGISPVKGMKEILGGYTLDTGCPHFVKFVDDLESYPVFEEGNKIRYNPIFPSGTNANFAKVVDQNTIAIRTYERGVECETLACGTGATATAIAATLKGFKSPVHVETRGGMLTIDFKKISAEEFTQVHLTGPAELVFEGQISI